MSMNWSRKWIAGAIVATIAAGCAGGDTGDEEPITIGVLYSQSGSGQVYGVPSLLGHNMAVDKINAAGGILGRQVETVLLDDASDGETAGSLARDLITRDGVDFLIGGVTSAVGLAMSNVARQEQVIYLSTLAKTGALMDSVNFHPYVFRVAANTKTEARSMAILADRLGFDKICTLLLNYSYGQSTDVDFRAAYAELRPDAEIVHQAWPTLEDTDYTAHITNILNAGCDGVVAGLWGSKFTAFAKQAAPLDFFNKVQYISAGEIGTPEVSQELGAEMPAGVWGNSYELFYYPDTPEHEAYLTELRVREGKEFTSSFAIQGYISMQFLAEAIEAAGTIETEAVAAALRGLTIQTPIGPRTMTVAQEATTGEYWGQSAPSNIEGYNFNVLNPVEYISAEGLMD
jgi:branched-chain amino acid transport system substrate-binding protein